MKNTKLLTHGALAAFAALTLAPATAVTQTQLPEPQALIARYVDAVGGREAVLRPDASRTLGTFELPAAGLRGALEIVASAPNRLASKVTIEGLGTMQSGFDGTVAWSLDPMTGARLLTGAEGDALRDQADQLASVRDASLFTTMHTIERTELGGEQCYLVHLVWQSGRESYDCYSAETGLLVATKFQQQSPMGTMDVTTTVSDYREFNGVKMPTRIVQAMMGMQQVMTIISVEFDDVDVSAVEPPAEIRTLIQSGS
jgi:hypothetical protein